MNNYRLNLLINRILSGYLKFKFDDNILLIGPLDITKKYLIEEIYMDLCNEGQKDGLLSIDSSIEYLIKQDLWSQSKNLEIDAITNQIEDTKIALYDKRLKSHDVRNLRQRLELFEKRYTNLNDTKYSLYYATYFGFASVLKTYYTVGYSLYNINGSYVWNDDIFLSKYDDTLSKAVDYYLYNKLDDKTFREIVKSSQWSSLWSSSKLSLFPSNSANWTEDQHKLASWAHIYENIRSHQDCPNDDVLQDDDMLDGWMLIQHRKAQDERKTKSTDDVSNNPKIAGADEVFIIAKSKEEIQKINELNNMEAKITKKQRESALNSQGKLQDGSLPDKMLQRQIQKNRLMIEKMRNRK